ncbi:MAG: carboxylating nicotinate-nucleotide diphosphorylase [Candidatus Aenigmarchaeota archaeon]|nr:carboxylating nicotinate-nucleotide diphosphorylase [Candidatus Aenigmarchaeota archaeon]
MFEDYLDYDVEPFKEKIKKRVYEMYEDDLGTGDITTEAVIKPMIIKAIIKAKDDGILAGVFEARSLLEKLGVKVKESIKEGSEIKKGDVILELEGDARKIMQAERTVLNFLTRLSGIATLTSKMVKETKTKVASTRKTCFSFSDKYAVKLGGGYTHRLGLFDMYLIKRNHIDAVCKELKCSRIDAIRECLRRVRERNKDGKKVEIEVENVEEALAAAKEKPDIIMLDWVRIPDVKKVVKLLKKSGICLEASGGVKPDNVKEFGETGVDFVSSGYITHSCKALDMSLEVLE